VVFAGGGSAGGPRHRSGRAAGIVRVVEITPRGPGGGKPPAGLGAEPRGFAGGCGGASGYKILTLLAAEFGRGARPRAGCVVAPRWLPAHKGNLAGGKPCVEPARLELFLRGGLRRRVEWSAGGGRRDPRFAGGAGCASRDSGGGCQHMACESAGRGCRSRSGTERAGVPSKKRIIAPRSLRRAPCPGRCERSEYRCAITEASGSRGPAARGAEWPAPPTTVLSAALESPGVSRRCWGEAARRVPAFFAGARRAPTCAGCGSADLARRASGARLAET
jgi:hypothetical protein